MKCFYNQAEVSHPCSSSCHLFADCLLEWVKKTEFERAEKTQKETAAPSYKTNFDKIKEMTVKEFSKKFFESFACELCQETDKVICKNSCAENFEKWLVSSCED